jgi:hypothetical protein
MDRKQPGQRFSFTARLYNDLVEIVSQWRQGKFGNRRDNGQRSPVLRIRNDSGGDLDRFAILGIDGVVFAESDNSNEFKGNPTLKGTTPVIATHAGKFAVLMEPCKNGKFARCMVSGHAVVQVDMIDADDNWCDVKASNAELSSYGAGSAQILHKPSGTGVKWCVVNLAQSYGPATEYRGLINDAGGFATTDATTAMDGLEAVDGVPVETTLATVYNVFSWSGADDAEAIAVYNATTEEWELRMVACA